MWEKRSEGGRSLRGFSSSSFFSPSFPPPLPLCSSLLASSQLSLSTPPPPPLFLFSTDGIWIKIIADTAATFTVNALTWPTNQMIAAGSEVLQGTAAGSLIQAIPSVATGTSNVSFTITVTSGTFTSSSSLVIKEPGEDDLNIDGVNVISFEAPSDCATSSAIAGTVPTKLINRVPHSQGSQVFPGVNIFPPVAAQGTSVAQDTILCQASSVDGTYDGMFSGDKLLLTVQDPTLRCQPSGNHTGCEVSIQSGDPIMLRTWMTSSWLCYGDNQAGSACANVGTMSDFETANGAVRPGCTSSGTAVNRSPVWTL